MFSKTVLVFTIFVGVIAIGSALKCYVCAGTSSSDCAQGKRSSMGTQLCPNVTYSSMSNYLDSSENYGDEARLQAVCLRFSATNFQPNVLIRECGVFPASVDPCNFLQQHAPVKNCRSCNNDFCNIKVDDPVVEMML